MMVRQASPAFAKQGSRLLFSVLFAGCTSSPVGIDDEQSSQASETPSSSQSQDDEHSEEESEESECPGYVLRRIKLKSLDETVHHELSAADFLAPVVKDRHFRFAHRPIPEFQVNPSLDGHQAQLQIEYKGGEIILHAWTKIEDDESDADESSYAQPQCVNGLDIEVETRLIVPELDIATRWDSTARYSFYMNEALDIATLDIDVSTSVKDITASFEDKLIPTEPAVFPGDSLDGFLWDQAILLKGSKLEIYFLEAAWYILLANPKDCFPQAEIPRIFSPHPLEDPPSPSGGDGAPRP